MKLYKFRPLANETDFNRAKDILETSQFYCSRFSELNDPMEGVFYIQGDSDEMIEKIYNSKTKYKICSFSGGEGFKNPLMWGYYANGFKGIAIEIEIDKEDVRKVRYADNISTIQNSSEIETILLTKCNAWRHEKEWRYLNGSENTFDDRPFRDKTLNLRFRADVSINSGLETSGVSSQFYKIGEKISAIYFGFPYRNIDNWEKVYADSKCLQQYARFRRRLIAVAHNKDIKCFSVKIGGNYEIVKGERI